MRLLHVLSDGCLTLTKDLTTPPGPYAILSHTWAEDDDEEVNFDDIEKKTGENKAGYTKLRFCVDQAKIDGLQYCWVDTCCINRANLVELDEAIRSMFRWYQHAEKCYVYMWDVSTNSLKAQQSLSVWQPEFQRSKWFTRGWTLQELLAPRSVEFFSRECGYLGSKTTLEPQIHGITQLPIPILRGESLSLVDPEERFRWIQHRRTKKPEDRAYCLLGVFDVTMPTLYGEGEDKAFGRLREEIGITLHEIGSTIRKSYTEERLQIQRLSGRVLPLCNCYINLCIVDHRRDSDTRKQGLQHSFSLASRLSLYDPPRLRQLSLESMFQIRQRSNGEKFTPRSVLVWGRAGMGKTTLCKKIVSDFYNKGLWRHRYDHLVWLPLRYLKLPEYQTACNSVELIMKVFGFLGREKNLVAQVQATLTQNERTLFLLDGLDEVSNISGPDCASWAILRDLLSRRNIIITSRPHYSSVLHHNPPDIELDTVGFLSEQVQQYIQGNGVTTKSSTQLSAVQQFLSSHPIIQTLARIPVQLDAICYAWDQDHSTTDIVTMTGLYCFISRKLWGEFAARHGTIFKGRALTKRDIQNLDVTTFNNRSLVRDEQKFVQQLAFHGLCNLQLEFGAVDMEPLQQNYGIMDKDPIDIPFLRSSDTSLKIPDRTLHFVHLTFQEFFAAQYFVHCWMRNKALRVRLSSSKHSPPMHPHEFVTKEKYTDRYNIFWRFVTGLLSSSSESIHLDQFLDLIHEQSVDLVGIGHQRLIIHCLREIDPGKEHFNRRIRELEEHYIQWVFCQLRFSNDYLRPSLMAENECSDFILKNLLQDPRTCGATLEDLGSRPFISLNIVKAIPGILSGSTVKRVRRAAIRVLGVHSDSGGEELLTFWHSSQDTSARQRREIVAGLAHVTTLQPTAVDALTGFLGDSNPRVRCKAARILGNQETVPATATSRLIALLGDPDQDVCLRAVRALSQKRLPAAAFNELVALLRDSNPRVRFWAVTVLRDQESLPDSALTGLVALLRDSDQDVRSGAISALGDQQGLTAAAINELVLLLGGSDRDMRFEAARALGGPKTLSEAAANGLVELLKQSDPQMHSAGALKGQKILPEPAITGLVALLRDADPHVRSEAAGALGGPKSLPAPTINCLVALLRDPDPRVRSAAVTALADQKTLSEPTIAGLVTLLGDANRNVQLGAARALGDQRTLPDTTVDHLVTLLGDSDSNVRFNATRALGGPKSLQETAVIGLVALLRDPDCDVRIRASRALRDQKTLPEAAITGLIALLTDSDQDVRSKSARTLGAQKTLSERATDKLVALLKGSDPQMQLAGITALKSQKSLPEPAITGLVALLGDSDQDVRSEAAKALRDRKNLPEQAITGLLAHLRDSQSNVRSMAAGALGEQTILPETAIAGLVALFEDRDQVVRSKAARALKNRKRLPEAAVAGLVTLLSDSNFVVGMNAAEALEDQKSLSEAAVNALLNLSPCRHLTARRLVGFLVRLEAFLPFVPDLHVSMIKSFVEAWLREEFVVYISDTVLHVRSRKSLWSLPLETDQQSKLQDSILRAREKLGLPSISSKADDLELKASLRRNVQ